MTGVVIDLESVRRIRAAMKRLEDRLASHEAGHAIYRAALEGLGVRMAGLRLQITHPRRPAAGDHEENDDVP
jgi:hypothetical protein